jgi:hypothetical protein
MYACPVFANRVTELAALRRWWASERPRPAVLWGRRRVGKTALLQEFSRDLPAIFHTGTGQSATGELASLSRKIAAVRPPATRDLAQRPYRDWEEALDDLAAIAADEPLLVVLDEFPELVHGSPALPGMLRAFLDRAHGHTQLRLLLCGSAVRHMEAAMEYRAPLYGRFDLTLQLQPFTPSEAGLLLPELSPGDRALVYGLLGGIPLYLSWWDQRASVADNLLRLACQPAARLLTEGQLTLATEVERGELPSAVLHAIAAGKTKHHEIRDWIGADPTRTLDRLIRMRLVERLLPVTETTTSRRRIYRIADQMLGFYLGVLNRVLPEIERGLGPSILPVVLAALDDYLGAPWEAAMRDHLRRLAVAGELVPEVVAVGPFWTSAGLNQIDAVVLAGRAREPVLAAEAKWARVVVATRVVAGLRRKCAALPGSPEDLPLLVCAREQVRDLPEGVRAVTAADIFSVD